MSNTVIKPKTFLNLCNNYYQKFLDGVSLEEAIVKLTVEECIYWYNKDINAEDLNRQTGFIETDEDIEKNWKALSFAIYKFFGKPKTKHEVVDSYILEFSSMNDEDILELNNEDIYALKMTNTDKIW